MKIFTTAVAALFSAPAVFTEVAAAAESTQPLVCLIVRSGTNIYFGAMLQGATNQAANSDTPMKLQTYYTSQSGTVVGIEAAKNNANHINRCVEDGAAGILVSIAPDEPGAITPFMQNAVAAAQAAGVVVLALDSPIGTFVNSTIKTNNTAAGYAVGRYSYLSHPGDDGQVAVLFCPIAYDRNIFDRIVGFVSGYDLNVQYSDYGEEEEDHVVNYYTDPDIVAAREYQCSVAESAEKGMIDILDNVKNGTSSMPSLVYATNEVGAFGVLAALQKRGLENKIRIATIDGSCYGVEAVRDGLFSVEAIQRPEKMGELGILELDRWLTYGINPFDVDSGFDLAVTKQVDGAPGNTMEEALNSCFDELPNNNTGSTTSGVFSLSNQKIGGLLVLATIAASSVWFEL